MTDEDRRILEFERLWWRTPGAKENAIREQFGLSPTRYYQRLNHLLSTHEALQFDPIQTNRLRRIRSARQDASDRTSVQ
ncbi:DUF3263 domain-containing protein [Williamsia deligens]|uniref:DUF3263 domain-containing protein n=1 Tax=Williamsia deligens TaxID=321325 RepID=A0ABW3GB09_9NOCA|nr:DUF3263 domain-containing protein [Williamsia deligens]